MQALKLLSASLLFCVLLFGACAETDPRKPGYWLDRLDDPDEQSEALMKLAEMKATPAVPELMRRFNAKAYLDIKAPIATCVARIGDRSVIPALIEGLDYTVGAGADKKSRAINRANEKIVEALGMFKAKEAVDSMIRMLDARDPYVQKATCRALGSIGSPKAVPKLSSIVLNHKNMNIRRTAVEALGDIGHVDGIPALIKAMFIERGASLYPQASFSLFQVGPAAVDPLVKVLDGKDQEINLMSEQYNFIPVAIVAKSVEVLGDLRPNKLEARFIKLFKKYDDLSQKAKDEKKFNKLSPEDQQAAPYAELVKRNIAMAFEKMGSSKAAKLLSKIIIKETDYTVREFYTLAINHIGERSVVKELLKAAESGDANARRVVLRAYTRLGTDADLKAMDTFAARVKTDKASTTDAVKAIIKRERVRLVAYGECKDSVDCWLGKLKDANDMIRDKAAYELGRLGDAKVVDALVNATSDSDENVRRAAIWSLFQFKSSKGIASMEKTLAEEHGKPAYIRINEELKRLVVYLKREARAS